MKNLIPQKSAARSALGGLALTALAASGLGAAGCGSGKNSSNLYLTWIVTEARYATMPNPPPRKCEDLGVATVTVAVTPGGQRFDFACSASAGETFKFDSGTYTIQASALGVNNQALDVKTFPNVYVFGRTPVGDGNLVFAIP